MLLPMPIIVGAPRSGTTLLRFMLDAHPELAIPPETGFLALAQDFEQQGDALRAEFFERVTHYPPHLPNWQDFALPSPLFWQRLCELEPFTLAEGYRTFYRLYAARFDKPRWGDKTPAYCFFMPTIQAVLPEARFIHLIRDGRDAALSLRPLWFSPGKEIETLAQSWQEFVSTARQQSVRTQHYLEVRYEQLVLQPTVTLQRICSFLELPFDEAMLSYHTRVPQRLAEHKGRIHADGSVIVSDLQRYQQQRLTTEPPNASRVQAWKTVMSSNERIRFENVAGDLLRELDYEVNPS